MTTTQTMKRSADYPRYRYGWRVTRSGEVYAHCQPSGGHHANRHDGDLLIGRLYRHGANPRYWVAETLDGYCVPTDGRTQSEAGGDLYDAYLAGVAHPRGYGDSR
jgi:hypothetical protein